MIRADRAHSYFPLQSVGRHTGDDGHQSGLSAYPDVQRLDLRNGCACSSVDCLGS
jgi:hypothetical protein